MRRSLVLRRVALARGSGGAVAVVMTFDMATALGALLAGGFIGWHVRAAYGRGMAAWRKLRGGWVSGE